LTSVSPYVIIKSNDREDDLIMFTRDDFLQLKYSKEKREMYGEEQRINDAKKRVEEIAKWYLDDLERYFSMALTHGDDTIHVPVLIDNTQQFELMSAVDTLLFELNYDWEWVELDNPNSQYSLLNIKVL